MIENSKSNAAILIIGNEILSGRTQDTNTSTLATWLNTLGVKVGKGHTGYREHNHKLSKFIKKRIQLCIYFWRYWSNP